MKRPTSSTFFGSASISKGSLNSAAIARIALPYSPQEFTDILLALIRENELRQDLHIRLSAFVGEDNGRLDSVELCWDDRGGHADGPL